MKIDGNDSIYGVGLVLVMTDDDDDDDEVFDKSLNITRSSAFS